MKELTLKDIDFILDCLKNSKLKFESEQYPSYEFKQQKMQEISDVISKIQTLKKDWI